MKNTIPFCNSRLLIILVLSNLLFACITMPGHRQIIKEKDFKLLIITPNEQTKRQILFDQKQTKLIQLPINSSIIFNSQSENGQHEVVIKSVSGSLVYDYRLNGQTAPFDNEAQAWLTKQIPKIIAKSGLNTHK